MPGLQIYTLFYQKRKQVLFTNYFDTLFHNLTPNVLDRKIFSLTGKRLNYILDYFQVGYMRTRQVRTSESAIH